MNYLTKKLAKTNAQIFFKPRIRKERKGKNQKSWTQKVKKKLEKKGRVKIVKEDEE